MNEWIAQKIFFSIIERLRGETISKFHKDIAHIPYLPRHEIRKLQLAKLNNTLQTSYQEIPFYRNRFHDAGIDIKNLSLPFDLKKIPLLNKQDIQNNYDQLVNHRQRKRISKDSTSGSSGNPLIVIKDIEKSAYIRAVMFRCYGQYGLNIGDKQARFWGVPLSPRNYIVEKLKDFMINRIRLSAFALDDRSFSQFADKIERFRPKYFCGYPSLIYKFAQWLSEKNILFKKIDLSVIITTGEILHDFQRELIENTFKCKVANEYGATEVGVIAFECLHGKLHVNSDHLFVETVDSDQPHKAKEIVITELNNKYNPLIRYKVGDMGELSDAPCDCGIGFPILSKLKGREDSYIITPENKHVYDAILAYTFKRGVKQFQGIQNRKDELIVKIVKSNDFTVEMSRKYKQQLEDVLGNSIKIQFDIVPNIEPGRSGKLKYFISHIQDNR